MQKEEMRITQNGVPIYSYRNEALHGFFLSLFVRTGCPYEAAGQEGITHFLEHTAIRNVEKISGGALYRDLDRFGLDFNATTYTDVIQFFVSGASSHFAIGAKYISELLSPIVLSRKEVDAERKRIKAEIRESDDKNSLTTFSNGIVYRGTPLAGSILGTVKSVNAQTASSLEAYRKSVFLCENIFFYLTGNFSDRDIEILSEMVSAYEIPHGVPHSGSVPVPEGFFARAPEIAVKSADYTVMRFSFDLDMTKVSIPETDLLYDVLLSGNNSRFYMEMSERRGMFYDIAGSIERYANIGCFYFNFEIQERNAIEAAELTVGILNDFCKNPPLPEDMMKADYVDNAYMLYDDACDFNFTYAYDSHVHNAGYRTVEDRIAAYRKITPERLCEIAHGIFRPENLVLTVKGNKKKIDTDALRAVVSKLGKE